MTPRLGRALPAAGAGLVVAATAASLRAPSFVFADAGELLTAVARGGVAHPPGFPLYLLSGGLWLGLAVPAGMPAASALNLFSSLCDGAAAALVVLAASALLARAGTSLPAAERAALSVAAGLLAGFGATLFDFSLSIEVYALHAVFLAGALATAIAAGGEEDSGRRRFLSAALGLFVGGGLAVHHATMIVILPGLFLAAAAAGEATRERARRFGLFVAGTLPGLLCYAVLPLRASLQPPLNWGNPSNLFRFGVHVTARDYQVNIDGSLEKTLGHAGRFLSAYRGEFSAAGLVIAALGLAWLLRRRPLLGVALLAVLAGDIAFSVRYDIAEDQAAYYIPVFLATALLFAVGAASLAGEARRLGGRATRAVAAAALVAAVLVGGRNVAARAGRRADRRAPEAAANVLSSAPPGALVFTTEWNLYAPVLAVQELEGAREDVLVLDVLLLRRGWYLDALARRHAVRLAGAREALESYRRKLADWEEGRPYEPDALTELFEGFTRRLTEATWERGLDVVWVGSLMGRQLPPGAALVPSGVGYRVLRDGEAARRFVGDTPVSFAAAAAPNLPRDEIFEEKIRPLEAGMRVQRALYDDAFGKGAEARAALAAAARFSPEDPGVVEVEGDFLLREGRAAEALDRYAASARRGGDAARLAEKSRAAQAALKSGS